MELSEATQAVYLERLQKLSPEALTYATNRVNDEWSEASKMPPLAFILARAEDFATLRQSNRLLELPDKPDDWDPEFAKKLLDEVRRAKMALS